jgi:hypothetical protein
MANPVIPHFDLPFRVIQGSISCVEQDSNLDVANCVEAIVRTPLGERKELDSFGLPELAFLMQPMDLDEIKSYIAENEPRAAVLLEQNPDVFDVLIDHLKISVVSQQEQPIPLGVSELES